MKGFILMHLILLLLSCNERGNSGKYSERKQDTAKSTFAGCFANPDTTVTGEGISCAGWVYKRISDRYIIRVSSGDRMQEDSCYTLTINETSGKNRAELWVFDQGGASLAAVCSDVVPHSSEQPRQLYAQSGQMVIGFSDPVSLHGNTRIRTTVFIEKLIFKDSKTGKDITIENELIWKVLDMGTPG